MKLEVRYTEISDGVQCRITVVDKEDYLTDKIFETCCSYPRSENFDLGQGKVSYIIKERWCFPSGESLEFLHKWVDEQLAALAKHLDEWRKTQLESRIVVL